MKFTIKGEEFDFDFYDADEMERVEAACARVEERCNEAMNMTDATQSQVIRAQCGIIFDFFDEVFGEGAHKRIFKGKCNLLDALNSFDAFIQAKNSSVSEIKAVKDKYDPNRAQRRAAQKANGSNRAPVPYNGPRKGKRHH